MGDNNVETTRKSSSEWPQWINFTLWSDSFSRGWRAGNAKMCLWWSIEEEGEIKKIKRDLTIGLFTLCSPTPWLKIRVDRVEEGKRVAIPFELIYSQVVLLVWEICSISSELQETIFLCPLQDLSFASPPPPPFRLKLWSHCVSGLSSRNQASKGFPRIIIKYGTVQSD